MPTLRLLAAPLAFLLACVVGGGATDFLPCSDTDCGEWSALVDPGAPPDDAPGDAPTGEAPCPCHVAFVPPAPATADEAARAPDRMPEATDYARPPSAPGRVLDPPPRG